MKMDKKVKNGVMKAIAKVTLNEAKKNANSACSSLHGQPKLPKEVAALKKLK